METTAMLLAAVFLLTAAVYVQRKIPFFTKGAKAIAIARLMLIVIGLVLGGMSAAMMEEVLPKILIFIIGFGVVHVPAAVILFIKGQRGSGKS